MNQKASTLLAYQMLWVWQAAWLSCYGKQ